MNQFGLAIRRRHRTGGARHRQRVRWLDFIARGPDFFGRMRNRLGTKLARHFCGGVENAGQDAGTNANSFKLSHDSIPVLGQKIQASVETVSAASVFGESGPDASVSPPKAPALVLRNERRDCPAGSGPVLSFVAVFMVLFEISLIDQTIRERIQ
jgi:hypothetical protein